MARLGDLSDESVPLLVELQRAAPDLDELFTRLGPFAKASRPALDALGEAGKAGTDAFAASDAEARRAEGAVRRRPRVRESRCASSSQTMDDRKRGLEHDARAKAGAPPAPDPTAIPDTGPFTGLESIWNYAFWQTLSVNMFDGQAHIVRLGLQLDEDCSQFQNNPSQAVIDKCNQWLGPDQPGITTPDPTAGGAGAARVLAESGQAGRASGRAPRPGRARGGPAARPARHLEAAGRPAAGHPGPARQPEAEGWPEAEAAEAAAAPQPAAAPRRPAGLA